MALYIFMFRVYAFIVSLQSVFKKEWTYKIDFAIGYICFLNESKHWKVHLLLYNFLTGFPINDNNLNYFKFIYIVNLMISQVFLFILVCIISNIFTITYREFFGKCLTSSIFHLFLCVLKVKAEDKLILSIF